MSSLSFQPSTIAGLAQRPGRPLLGTKAAVGINSASRSFQIDHDIEAMFPPAEAIALNRLNINLIEAGAKGNAPSLRDNIIAFANHDFGFVHQALSFTRLREGAVSLPFHENDLWRSQRLELLTNYGPQYLSEFELRSTIRAYLKNYYHYFGEQLYNKRDREFWRMHLDRLAQLGYPLRRTRLLIHAALFALEAAVRRFQRIF